MSRVANSSHRVTALRRTASVSELSNESGLVWLTKAMDEVSVADLAGHDVLIHLASAGVSPQKATVQELFYWNVSAMVGLLDKAKLANIKRVVVAGSFAEYGQSFNHYDFIPVDAPLKPTSLYAASKAASYVAATAFAIESNIELCYLRIFSAFGEGQYEGNFWPALRAAAVSGKDFPMTPGEQVRDYVPVELVAKAIEHSAERPDVRPGEPLVLNVGSGVPVSMLEFAKYWWDKWEAKGRLLVGALPYRENEVMRCVAKI